MAENVARTKAVKVYNNDTTDLRFEIDSLKRLVQHARQSLENSLTGQGPSKTFGYKKDGLSRDDAASIQALATSLEKLVTLETKYRKYLKDTAEQLTQEEELDALEEYFAGLESVDRRAVIRRLIERHNGLNIGSGHKTVTANV